MFSQTKCCLVQSDCYPWGTVTFALEVGTAVLSAPNARNCNPISLLSANEIADKVK